MVSRLPRPCEKCEKTFQPKGKRQKRCEECLERIRFSNLSQRFTFRLCVHCHKDKRFRKSSSFDVCNDCRKDPRIPPIRSKPCERCGKDFLLSHKGRYRYCELCSSLALQEMFRKSQAKYFASSKGQAKLKEGFNRYKQTQKYKEGVIRRNKARYTQHDTTNTSYINNNRSVSEKSK